MFLKNKLVLGLGQSCLAKDPIGCSMLEQQGLLLIIDYSRAQAPPAALLAPPTPHPPAGPAHPVTKPQAGSWSVEHAAEDESHA